MWAFARAKEEFKDWLVVSIILIPPNIVGAIVARFLWDWWGG